MLQYDELIRILCGIRWSRNWDFIDFRKKLWALKVRGEPDLIIFDHIWGKGLIQGRQDKTVTEKIQEQFETKKLHIDFNSVVCSHRL